jgi:integrase
VAEVKCSEVTPDLWSRYFEVSLKKFDRKLDYTTRRAENIRLNAAVRAARCLFLPKLAPGYAAKGLAINANAANCMMLPEPWLPVSEAEDEKLLQAWPLLRQSNPRLWLAVGLARFAGLRREEIMRIRGKWIEAKEAAAYVVLRDRNTESAIIARQAGLKAAQEGLGHTSPRTTEKHYLDAVR